MFQSHTSVDVTSTPRRECKGGEEFRRNDGPGCERAMRRAAGLDTSCRSGETKHPAHSPRIAVCKHRLYETYIDITERKDMKCYR